MESLGLYITRVVSIDEGWLPLFKNAFIGKLE